MTEIYFLSKKELFEIIEDLLDKFSNLLDKKLKKQNDNHEDWIDDKECQKILKRGRTTLAKYRQEGILPYSQIGRKIMYKRKDLEQFIMEHYSK